MARTLIKMNEKMETCSIMMDEVRLVSMKHDMNDTEVLQQLSILARS